MQGNYYFQFSRNDTHNQLKIFFFSNKHLNTLLCTYKNVFNQLNNFLINGLKKIF